MFLLANSKHTATGKDFYFLIFIDYYSFGTKISLNFCETHKNWITIERLNYLISYSSIFLSKQIDFKKSNIMFSKQTLRNILDELSRYLNL